MYISTIHPTSSRRIHTCHECCLLIPTRHMHDLVLVAIERLDARRRRAVDKATRLSVTESRNVTLACGHANVVMHDRQIQILNIKDMEELGDVDEI
jgi:hypothetical protein